MRNPGPRIPIPGEAEKGKMITSEEPERSHKTKKFSIGWGHENIMTKEKKRIPTSRQLSEERKREYKYRDFPTG